MFSKAAMAPILQKSTVASVTSLNPKPSVAVIGSGAAGLVTARILSLRGFKPCIFEKEPSSTSIHHQNRNDAIGGVWSYESKSKVKPMYKGLRTNLPRELMAFREKKWGGDGVSMSFVTHSDVQQYLIDYAKDHNLEQYISFGCNVKQLTVCKNKNKDDEDNNDNWPKVEIEWEQSNSIQKEIFDAVCICNGHYSAPFSPNIPGIEHFQGKIMHSVEYDDPKIFQDQTVLCVGGRASGSDLAREISAFAKKVYLSDTSCPIEDDGLPITMDNVAWVPKTTSINEKNGRINFEESCVESPKDVDVIIFCSGYDYHFPFINEKSNLELENIPGERRVSPLFEQMWHAQHPNIAFLGLQHSVVPFPFFELQAEAIAQQLSLKMNNEKMDIPSTSEERMDAATIDKNSGGPKDSGRVQDTHFLGSFQWEACRKYARYGNVLDESVHKYISTNQAIYDDSNNARKGAFPGGPDNYRYQSYIRDDENESFHVYPITTPEGDKVTAEACVETVGTKV